MSTQPSHPQPYRVHRARGFTLIELSIVLSLFALAITSFIQIQREQQLGNTALAVAQAYQRMNKAVSGYMQTYYSVLTDESKIRPECSNTYWRAGATGSARSNGCRVSLQINGGAIVQVDNGLQPTPNELAQLGFLSGGSSYTDVLPLTTLSDANPNLVFTTDNFLVKDNTGSIVPRYMVVIQNICINGGTSSVVTVTGSCTTGSKDLRSWVFNSQPYIESQTSGTTVLDRALDQLGTDGYLSGLADPSNPNASELRSVAKSPEPLQPNFTRNASGVGAPYILAVRSGYGSADWSLFKKQVDDLTNRVDTMSGNLSTLTSTVNGINATLDTKINTAISNYDFNPKITTALNNYDFNTKITNAFANYDFKAKLAEGAEYAHLKIHPCFDGDLEITYQTFLNKVKKEQFFTATNRTCQFGSYGGGEGWVVTDLPYDSWMPVLQEGNWFTWGFKTGYVLRNNRNVWAFWMYGQQNGGWLQYAHFTFVRTGTDITQTDKIEGFGFGRNPGMTETGQYFWASKGLW